MAPSLPPKIKNTKSTLPHAKHTKQNTSTFLGGKYAERGGYRYCCIQPLTVIQCQSYKHNYARPNNNCEMTGIARGQEAMREGMETIRPATLAVVKSLNAIRSILRGTWQKWPYLDMERNVECQACQSSFLSSIRFTMQLLNLVCPALGVQYVQ